MPLHTMPKGRSWTLIAVLILSGCGGAIQQSSSGTPAVTAAASPSSIGSPIGIIALGHSALTAENSDPARPGEPALENSWATGTNPDVDSIYQRLVALKPETENQVFNAARGGAPVEDLPGQANTALFSVSQPQLAIIQTIDGDIRCDGSDDAHVAEFGEALLLALENIAERSPGTTILVLGQAGRPAMEAERLADHPDIRKAFGGTGICDFFDPDGNLVPAALDTLTGIIEMYEAEQDRVCRMVANCHTDEGIMQTFEMRNDYLTEDWNHINVQGQAALAEFVWPLVEGVLDLP